MKRKDRGLGIEKLEHKSVLSTIVGILDSGVDIYHQDLLDNIWVNTQEIKDNSIDDDNNGYIDDIHGWNFIENNNQVVDAYGHGTHVAGIVQGINPSVKIIALKIISNVGVGAT